MSEKQYAKITDVQMSNLYDIIDALQVASRLGCLTITIEMDAYNLGGNGDAVCPWVKSYMTPTDGKLPKQVAKLVARQSPALWVIRNGVMMVYPSELYDGEAAKG